MRVFLKFYSVCCCGSFISSNYYFKNKHLQTKKHCNYLQTELDHKIYGF